eukprot:1190237-Prorocentrum_minimum.AAC.3
MPPLYQVKEYPVLESVTHQIQSPPLPSPSHPLLALLSRPPYLPPTSGADDAVAGRGDVPRDVRRGAAREHAPHGDPAVQRVLAAGGRAPARAAAPGPGLGPLRAGLRGALGR